MNNKSNNELGGLIDLTLSLFNQYLFQTAKENISDIQYFYRTNPTTSGNPLVENLLGAIKDYSLENIGMPLFQSILARSGKNEREGKEILDRIIEYKKYNKDQIEPAKEYIRDIVSSVYIERANSRFQNDPSGFLNYLKGVNIKTSQDDYLVTTSFDNIDINSIVADINSSVVTTPWDFINNAFTEGGFLQSDLLILSCPPSTGKSIFAEQMALHTVIKQKLPTIMFIFGDLTMSSLMVRLAAIWSGLSFKEAKDRLHQIYPAMQKEIGDLFDVVIAPAGTITADEIVDYVINSPKKYKACWIDYDEGVKLTAGTGSMYTDFGECYQTFTKLKDANIFTGVLCQPKVGTWAGDQPIQMGDLGTSSRKAAIADVVITGIRVVNNANNLLTISISKNRHGNQVIGYAIRLPNGRIKPIPKQVWSELKQTTEFVPYTETDIDRMVQTLMGNRAAVQTQVKNRMGSGAKPF